MLSLENMRTQQDHQNACELHNASIQCDEKSARESRESRSSNKSVLRSAERFISLSIVS